MGQEGGSRLPPEVFQYSGLGCTMAGGILLFAAGGWGLDRLIGSLPVFTIIGALAGVGLSSLSVWRRLYPVDTGPEEGDRKRKSRSRNGNP